MHAPIAWQWSRFADLATGDLYALLAARGEVFVVEQRCAYLDADGIDPHAWHLLGWTESDEQRPLAAYLRLIEPGRKFAEPSLGRVLTTPAFRGRGIGRVLMREGLQQAAALYPGCAVRLSAQRYLERFYAGFGFRVASDPYDEDGIAHVDMLRPADSTRG
jgi:ElaA protein